MATEKKSTNIGGLLLPIRHSRFSPGSSRRPPGPPPLPAVGDGEGSIFDKHRVKLLEALAIAKRIVEKCEGEPRKEIQTLERMTIELMDRLSADELRLRENPLDEGAVTARQWKHDNEVKYHRCLKAIADYEREYKPGTLTEATLAVFGDDLTDESRERLEIARDVEALEL